MNCRKAILGTCFFAFTLSLGALASRAQDEPQPVPDTPPQPMPDSPPKPAGRSFPGIPGIEIGQQGRELQPDFSPLTSMQNATLGYPEIRHSYWVPGIQFSSNLQSNPYGQS